MKIFTAKQIQNWDQYTISHEPISSLELMERAAMVFTDWLVEHLEYPNKVTFICGPGNNGGDGLAVARHLHHMNFPVEIIRCEIAPQSEDHSVQWERLPKDVITRSLVENDPLPTFKESDLLIDAVFGSGLSRPVTGYWGKLIQAMNSSKNIYAIDIPSGIFSEPKSHEFAIQAKQTLSFQGPKLSFFFPEYAPFLGIWSFKSIGLHPDYLQKTKTPYSFLQKEGIQNLLKVRSKFSHKGHFGHGLLYAGSKGMNGAAVLCARAALRAGLGLLTIHATREAYPLLQAQVPEAMVDVDPHDYCISTQHPKPESFRSIAAGSGLGQAEETQIFVQRLIHDSQTPLILDADALNIIARAQDLLNKLPSESILTPHPGEFDRLFGPHDTRHQRMETAAQKAQQYKCIIILKGAHTLIATPNGQILFNSTGNPGMASGGSGDALTGILLGLRAQGYSATDTAILGVFIHGLAADCALAQQSYETLLPQDMIQHLGPAFKEIHAA